MQPSLFDNSTLKIQSPNPLNKITEEKIAQPLTQVLGVVTPKPANQQSEIKNNSQSIKQSLDELFPEQQYDEKNIKKAKEILGSIADELTEEELQDHATKVQFLANSWLDDFERAMFGGLTLQELLHEKRKI